MTAVLDRRVSGVEAKRLDRVLRPFEKGGRFVAKHFDDIMDEYGEGWIAVHGNNVIAHSKTRLGLRNQLTRRGFKPNQLYTTYLTREGRTLIL